MGKSKKTGNENSALKIKTDDPANYWDLVTQLGDGAYGVVYKVKKWIFVSKLSSRLLQYVSRTLYVRNLKLLFGVRGDRMALFREYRLIYLSIYCKAESNTGKLRLHYYSCPFCVLL